jgi:hypothetical protein
VRSSLDEEEQSSPKYEVYDRTNGLGIVVPSSDEEKPPYRVFLIDSKSWVCGCEGYWFREKCRHIDLARNYLVEENLLLGPPIDSQ